MTSLWNSALTRLSGKVTPQTFEMWLRPIECARIEGNRIVLRAPNQYVRLWFESNYLSTVLDELRQEDSRDFHVEFEVSEAAQRAASESGSTSVVPPPTALDEPFIEPGAEPAAGEHAVAPGLNPKYRFETFVAGPSNQLAHAAARAVASPDPPKYNPLFICGGVGLGKTHLLHAIGNEIKFNRPSATILYLSGERFMNEYIHSIRNGKMHSFRQRYREECDVLLLDDIQFIANKDSTQEEFFHTFNALYEQQRQIVLSADRKPHEIPDVADRLRTRFAWGLMADIEPPELEVRVAILRKKADAEAIQLPDEVSLYIASSVKSNVRELEGALIRLAAYASLSRREITIDFAREVLEGTIARASEKLTVDQVLKAVASYYQVKVLDLKSERRHKSIATPRAVAMFLARRHTGDSFPDLGRAFGNKHHTTVLSACEKVAERVKTDPGLRSEVQAIESLLFR
ncbi:MAG TPA: chromosomal replication initiator protein DnaA [Haliangiales bacterium]|nr:chromosomal replication initiator protein DnaA [Haliangiales bacterium]